jgi:agmatine deiminase
MHQKPAEAGYRMPAEWEPHAATWIAWPHNREDWPGKFSPIAWVYVEIVRHLCRSEKVHIVIPTGTMKERVTDQLDAAGVDLDSVRFFKAKTNRSWLRDTAPTFVVNDQARSAGAQSVGLVDWQFNGWAKYPDHLRDSRLPRRIARWLDLPRWVPRSGDNNTGRRIVMEGGAIDVNGLGSLLATEECLLSDIQARNPQLDRSGIENIFKEYLAVSHVIWLGRGIAGDDTHGHVDDIARFVAPHTVLTVVEPCAADPNHEPLADNLQRLKDAHDQNGQHLNVVEMPMPQPLFFHGQRLPASYANFFIANQIVLVPTFNDPADRVALDTLAELFPDRQVIGIHSVDLVLGLGTLHCLTQQQPAGPPLAQTGNILSGSIR